MEKIYYKKEKEKIMNMSLKLSREDKLRNHISHNLLKASREVKTNLVKGCARGICYMGMLAVFIIASDVKNRITTKKEK